MTDLIATLSARRRAKLDALPGSLQPTVRVVTEVVNERLNQDAKWGVQNHPDGTSDYWVVHAESAKRENEWRSKTGNIDWRCILLEEVWEAFAETDPKLLREELVQVAAVAVAWVEAIDRR